MNKRILSKLGDYLLAHRDEIVGEWVRAVKQNPDISSVGHLKDEEELVANGFNFGICERLVRNQIWRNIPILSQTI